MNPLEQLAAKFATAYVPKYEQGSTGYVFTEEQLRRFREQVIEEEHKRLMEGSGEPAGYRTEDSTNGVSLWLFKKTAVKYQDPPDNLYTADQMAAAVLRERRRIAAFVEEQDVQHPKHIAAAIRSGA